MPMVAESKNPAVASLPRRADGGGSRAPGVGAQSVAVPPQRLEIRFAAAGGCCPKSGSSSPWGVGSWIVAPGIGSCSATRFVVDRGSADVSDNRGIVCPAISSPQKIFQYIHPLKSRAAIARGRGEPRARPCQGHSEMRGAQDHENKKDRIPCRNRTVRMGPLVCRIHPHFAMLPSPNPGDTSGGLSTANACRSRWHGQRLSAADGHEAPWPGGLPARPSAADGC